MLTYNEGKVCDAIVRYPEARHGVHRAELHSPEEEHHSDPVELVWKLASQPYALEHTGIEPFEGHVHRRARFKLTNSRIPKDESQARPGYPRSYCDSRESAYL